MATAPTLQQFKVTGTLKKNYTFPHPSSYTTNTGKNIVPISLVNGKTYEFYMSIIDGMGTINSWCSYSPDNGNTFYNPIQLADINIMSDLSQIKILKIDGTLANISPILPVTSSMPSDTQYFNATVNVAKYGHKVGDSIQVQVAPYPCNGAVGCPVSINTTYGVPAETWMLAVPHGANSRGFKPELTLGSQITDPTQLPSSPTTPNATIGTPTAGMSTTVKVLIGVAIVGTLIGGFFLVKHFAKAKHKK